MNLDEIVREVVQRRRSRVARSVTLGQHLPGHDYDRVPQGLDSRYHTQWAARVIGSMVFAVPRANEADVLLGLYPVHPGTAWAAGLLPTV